MSGVFLCVYSSALFISAYVYCGDVRITLLCFYVYNMMCRELVESGALLQLIIYVGVFGRWPVFVFKFVTVATKEYNQYHFIHKAYYTQHQIFE